MTNVASTTDEYLRSLPAANRRALSAVRAAIRAAVPGIEERPSRGVPFFRYRDRRVVGFGATARHLSFYVMEGEALRTLAHDLGDFDVSSTVIRFSPDRPLPTELIRKLVLARKAEIDRSLDR